MSLKLQEQASISSAERITPPYRDVINTLNQLAINAIQTAKQVEDSLIHEILAPQTKPSSDMKLHEITDDFSQVPANPLIELAGGIPVDDITREIDDISVKREANRNPLFKRLNLPRRQISKIAGVAVERQRVGLAINNKKTLLRRIYDKLPLKKVVGYQEWHPENDPRAHQIAAVFAEHIRDEIIQSRENPGGTHIVRIARQDAYDNRVRLSTGDISTIPSLTKKDAVNAKVMVNTSFNGDDPRGAIISGLLKALNPNDYAFPFWPKRKDLDDGYGKRIQKKKIIDDPLNDTDREVYSIKTKIPGISVYYVYNIISSWGSGRQAGKLVPTTLNKPSEMGLFANPQLSNSSTRSNQWSKSPWY